MYCEKCGKKRSQDELFCIECGNPYPRINNKNNQNKTDTALILGIISCIFIPFFIISVPLSIASIIIRNKNKQPLSSSIPAIISLIVAIIEIVIVIFGSIYFYNQVKNDPNDDFFKEYYDDYFYEEDDIDSELNIRGYSYIGDDNSILSLNTNNEYIWYKDKETKNTNFYQGTYKILDGDEAISYIASNLEEYGLTEYNQYQNIISSNHSINQYYLIILNYEKIVIDGIEEQPTTLSSYFYGYYEEDNYLDLTDISTNKKLGFTKKEAINQIDINKNITF